MGSFNRVLGWGCVIRGDRGRVRSSSDGGRVGELDRLMGESECVSGSRS